MPGWFKWGWRELRAAASLGWGGDVVVWGGMGDAQMRLCSDVQMGQLRSLILGHGAHF